MPTGRCWGWNNRGQIGDGTSGTEIERLTPVPVSGLTDATQIAAGGVFTCALIEGGTVKCWGTNNGGQLGDGTTTQRNSPVTVQFG